MAGGWDALRIKEGEGAGKWGLLGRSIPAYWAEDENGNRLTFDTKKEAEAGRRSREAEIRGLPRKRSDVFAERNLRKRLTKPRRKPILEVSAGPPITQGRKEPS